jgi:putative tryptophan/tyrosine transport system substrate-binding protein
VPELAARPPAGLSLPGLLRPAVAGGVLRLKLQRLEVRVPADFEGAFEAAIRQRAGALIAPGDPLVASRPRMLADLTLKYRLPTLMDNKEFVEAGGLLSQASHVIQ